jgi:hypothetical protein
MTAKSFSGKRRQRVPLWAVNILRHFPGADKSDPDGGNVARRINRSTSFFDAAGQNESKPVLRRQEDSGSWPHFLL